ncbi:Gfo/Idh/MocA family protein [Paenibacillus eucommiae]|uniref:Dehydrogenase n=1 Tax=Paenibacillus eucommiae TaxID=1355755 RepID=A0ABS4IVI8_9BACL|nr:Gfo/Idh/MocA family oxidoreductase [Paenibacillus eucommiae]MBP1990851.1 putative dehydrogenase [Paenibacillus eucommiae]
MKKIALVGAGGRALYMFAQPFASELQEKIEFCGVFDINPVRAKHLSEECGNVPVFSDFDQMIQTTQPDIVVVATTDDTHHTYIIAAMEAGCDVISEKPMTIDSDKCNAILETEKRTGRSLKVTFNMRFMPFVARVKELLMQGAIGDIHHVSLDWCLDRSHGADYFRRWHAELEHSGGLLVHKSTHHFDVMNWWLDSHPEQVHAFGSRRFYGPTREERGERCSTCNYTESCEFYFDVSKDNFTNRYYLQAEQEDGYIRDQCVFGERINIYDNMSVNVQYNSGALLTYSLVAYSPFEGFKATLHGTDGRLEVSHYYNGPYANTTSTSINVYKPNGESLQYSIPERAGGHGGGDELLRRMVFVGDVADPLGQQAGSFSGAMSLLIGAAANISIAEQKAVVIADLLAN